MPLIHLCGIDASGKTAHLQLIKAHLIESGTKCKYVWGRWPAFLSYPFLLLCKVLGFSVVNRGERGTYVCPVYYKNRAISKLWPWIFLFDTIIFAFTRIYLFLLCGYTVLCDRYVIDILVRLMNDIHDESLHMKIVGKLYLKLIPRSAVVILLDVDEEIAFKRKLDISSLTQLGSEREKFLKLAHELNIPRVDTSISFKEAHKKLVAIMTKEKFCT